MKKFSTEIKWGIIFTIVGLIWVVFEKLMGWHSEHIADHGLYTNIFAIVAIGVFVLALREKRDKDYDGLMTWKEGLISGFIISLVIMVLTPLSQYITYHLISPDYFTNAIDAAVANKHSTQETAEALFNFNSYMMISTLSAPSFGILTAAIVAYVVKTK